MRERVAALVGAALVVAGVIVLVTTTGQPKEFGWFAYTPPPRSLLDSLVVLSATRLLGAGLIFLGLVVLAATLGRRLGRGGSSARSVRTAGVVGGVLVLGGLVAFALVPRRVDIEYGGGYRLSTAPDAPLQLHAASIVWLPGQAWAAGVVAVGAITLVLALGLRYGRR